jgi:hypothetical protein
MDRMRRAAIWLEITKTSWRDRRSDEGGVADEAAMLAILLGGAVIIGGIVLSLLSDAEDRLGDIVLPG